MNTYPVDKRKKCPECLGHGFIYSWTRPWHRVCWSCMGTGDYMTAEELGRQLAEKHARILRNAVDGSDKRSK